VADVTTQRQFVEQAYLDYGHSVLRRARQILGEEQEARDVMQEVFVALLDRPIQFQGRSALGTYLYSATTHMCLNRLRNRRNRERLREERASAFELAFDPTRPDVAAALRQVLAVLPPDEARAAVHHYLDGMSHSEIGALLCCSRRRVGDLLDRMRARLSRESRLEAEGGRP
jgi:RNA polymerase sigma factor (sigma-70 family)